MSSIEKVVSCGMCTGCGACSSATRGAIPITLGRLRSVSADLTGVSPHDLAIGSNVCPFADETPNETVLAQQILPDAPQKDELLGSYRSLWVGRVGDSEDTNLSSSGGMTSWVAIRLMQLGHVDGIIHVAPTGDDLFGYVVSETPDQVRSRRKSAYYSTTFADAIEQIRGNGKRYAIVGVPCFIQGARLLARQDEQLATQLAFFLGLVCGHLKTRAFAEMLAWQVGVPPQALERVDFRVKKPGRSAMDYDFGAQDRSETQLVTRPTGSLVGGSWGHAMFQLEGCNFCDDIFAETADVAFGDAWLPEHMADWRGTNIVIIRNAVIEQLILDGIADRTLELNPLSRDLAAQSQSGNFRHRRVGLAVRLRQYRLDGKWTPKKRVSEDQFQVSAKRRKLILQRLEISGRSQELFERARSAGDLEVFLRGIRPLVARYRQLDQVSVVRRIARVGLHTAQRLRERLTR